MQENASGATLTPQGYEEGTLYSFSPDQSLIKGQIIYGVVLSIQTSKGKYLNLDPRNIKATDVKKNKKEK